MAVIETWLRQDLKGLVTVRSLQGQVFSLDNGGNLIGVKVTKDGQPVTLTGTVTGYCILSDGQTVTVTGSGKSGIQNGNEVYIVLPQLVYSVPGQISIVIKLTSGSVTTTLAACTGYVYRSRTSNEVVPPGTPIPDLATLEEAISRANAATDSANTAASSANTAATAAENVNVAMSKSGKVITITATNRSGTSTSHTVTEPTLTVQRANNVVTVTATDADGETSIEFDAVDADEVAELQEAVSTKAEEDGYYEELAAGTADQLVSTEAVTDTTPYLYRKSGGSVDIGNRETLEKIVGGTVAWNQLVDKSKFFATGTVGGYAFTNNGDGSFAFTIPETPSDIKNIEVTPNGGLYYFYVPANHKYIIADTNTQPVGIEYRNAYNGHHIGWNKVNIQDETGERVFLGVGLSTSTVAGTYTFKPQLFDLTAMFGPTIADYIYNLEQANAGAGVAWFRKLFPKDYYPYNPGELISVKATSHDMVGFNLWDEEWEVGAIDRTTGANRNANYAIRSINYISVLPNAQYAIRFSDKYRTGSFSSCLVAFYDHEKKFISAAASINAFTGKTLETFTTTGDTKYIRFHVGDYADQKPGNYYEDICINLSDPSRNGEYEPYEKHSYPLADVELRGVVSIDADGKLVYDGDEYTPDGNVKRKYSLVDLGTLNWVLDTTTRPADGATIHAAYAALPTAKKTDPANEVGNMFLAGYETTSVSFVDRAGLTVVKDKLVGGADMNGRIWLYDSAYNDLTREQVKTALSGSILLYELATPTTEQVDLYTAVQVVDDWGTEEFVDTREVAIPVGHSTSYMANLRDKLQHLPSLAEEDGEYIVKQTGSQMSLAPFKTGTYPDMHVGVADQLLSKQSIEDQVPYGFRQSGGGLAIGDHEENIIVGGTVGWNQFFESWATFIAQGGASFAYADGIGTAELPDNNAQIARALPSEYRNATHKYLTVCDLKLHDAAQKVWLFGGAQNSVREVTGTTNWVHAECLFTNPYGYWILRGSSTGAATVDVKNVMLINLTMLFGSAIADYIYSLEQTTAGAGVAWFKKLFPKDYYEYNAGELKSVEAVNSHEMVGFNLWDEEWEVGTFDNNTGLPVASNENIRSKNFIPVIPNKEYHAYVDGRYPWITELFYDSDLNYISVYSTNTATSGGHYGLFTIPANASYMKFRTETAVYGNVYKNDICISLFSSRNSEYEPYHKSSYPLDSSLTLRGIPKLNANNKLYYDGDTYAGDGTVTRKYGIVDLGTLTWSYNSTNGIFYSGDISHFVKTIRLSETANIICPKYETVAGTGYNGGKDKSISIGYMYRANDINIKDSAYTDAAAFKTAMSGVMLVYELEELTIEQAEPYQSVQQVDSYGTEEYTHSGNADVYIPVGHVTKYPTDLRSKIENTPDAPSGNGDYIVRKTAEGVSYVPLTQAKEIPAPPSANGTYRLTVTVANGTPTYSWVSA